MDINIKIGFDKPASKILTELLELLEKVCPTVPIEDPLVQAVPTPEAEEPSESPQEPQEDDLKAEEIPTTAVEEPETPAITLVELRAVAVQKSKINREQVKALIKKYGSEDLTNLDKTKYPELKLELEAI